MKHKNISQSTEQHFGGDERFLFQDSPLYDTSISAFVRILSANEFMIRYFNKVSTSTSL